MYAYKAKQRKQHICLALCHESDIMPSSHRPTRLDKTALSRLLLFLILNHLRFYWHCPHSMRSKVYATVGRPSVRPFVPSIDCSNVDRWVCCWVHRGQEISIDSCGRRAASAKQQMRAASRWEPTEEVQHRRVCYAILQSLREHTTSSTIPEARKYCIVIERKPSHSDSEFLEVRACGSGDMRSDRQTRMHADCKANSSHPCRCEVKMNGTIWSVEIYLVSPTADPAISRQTVVSSSVGCSVAGGWKCAEVCWLVGSRGRSPTHRQCLSLS